MRSMKTLGVFLLLGMAAVALAATPAWANFNPCEDLEGAAQEACVDRYTVESPPQRAYSDEETRWRAENDELRREIIEAVLDDYRNLETWKERLEFIRALREDAQQARRRGDLSDAASWDAPLPPDVIILDADLSEEAVGSEMYREFQLLNVYRCDLTGPQTFTGTVYISGNSTCTWNGNITVNNGDVFVTQYTSAFWQAGTVTINNGRLFVNYAATLTVRTTSTASTSVVVHGISSNDYAVEVYGTLYLRGLNDSRHVNFYVGSGKKISVRATPDQGYLRAEGTSTSQIRFWGANLNAWNGIEAKGNSTDHRGAKIRFNGGTASTKGIYIYSLASAATAIKHMGGTSSVQGLLYVRGTRFYGTQSSTNQVGIKIDGVSISTTQYHSIAPRIDYNSFWRYDTPIRINGFSANKEILIERNDLSYAFWGIELSEVRSTGSVSIQHNTIQATSSGIELSNVGAGAGTSFSVLVGGNDVVGTGSSTTGIQLVDVFQRSGGTCQTLIGGNTVAVKSTSIAFQIDDVSAYNSNCTQNSILQINSNSVNTQYPPHDCTNHRGIFVKNLPSMIYGASRDYQINQNVVNGTPRAIEFQRFGTDPIMFFVIQGNELSFISPPNNTLPEAFLIISEQAVHGFTIGGTSSKHGNIFGWNYGQAYYRHIYLGYGSSNNTCQNNVFLDQYGNPGGTPNLYGITCN